MPIDQLLKRHFWAVIVVLVAIAAFLDAQGIMHIVGASLGADETQLAVPPLMARLPAAPALGHAARDERGANPLAQPVRLGHRSAQRGAAASRRRRDVGSRRDISDPYSAPACDGVQVLVIAASPDPDWSFAALETPEEKGKSVLRRRGGESAARR